MALFKLTYGGTYPTLGAYSFAAAAPLDTRSVVDTISHLISKDVWKKPDYTAFNGLQVYVESTKELYILKDSDGLESDLQLETYFTGTKDKDGKVITPPATSDNIQAKVDLYWEKLASALDLSSLSGVFQFKGVAEAISADLRILTCGEAYILEQGKSVQLSCQATAYDLGLEMYYAWASSDANIRFWTDTDTLAKDTILYGKANDMQVYYIEDEQGERYYLNTNSVSPTGGDDIEGIDPSKCLGFLNKDASNSGDYENAIYIHCEGGPGVLTNGGTYPIVNMGTYSYTGQNAIVHIVDTCVFNELTGSAEYHLFADATCAKDLSESTRPVKSITAASDNRGDVYLIQENEYASNGQIWVKLGSPVEDWIII